jgi:predicted ATPase
MTAPSELFGRDDDLARGLLLLGEGARIVTVTGPAGFGKSAFAAVLGRMVKREGDKNPGVLHVSLDGVKDRPGILRRMSRALGLLAQTRADAVLSEVTKAGVTLVILDDADPVIAQVAALISRDDTATTSWLVTSREPLGIKGEQLLALGPLDVQASAKLFIARADASVSLEDARAVAELLEGIPLAIEMAAFRAQLLRPKELLARKSELLRMLRTERRDVPERHATLRAALGWSLERSTDDERRALCAMGAFSGPCTLEAIEAVAGAVLGAEADVVDVVQALLRRSWLTLDQRGDVVHVSMYETVRAFAREIAPEAELSAAIERHAAHYVDLAERAAAHTYGADAEAALNQLEDALPELLVAFERSRERSPGRAARIAVALSDLLLFRDAGDLRTPFFASAVAAADAANDPDLRARTRLLQARVALELGTPEVAHAALTSDIAGISEETRVELLRTRGWTALARGDAPSATAALEEARAHYERAREPRGTADALAALGVLSFASGNVEQGTQALQAAYAIHAEAGDTIRRAKVSGMAALFGLSLDEVPTDRDRRRDELQASLARRKAQGRSLGEAIDRIHLAALSAEPPKPEPRKEARFVWGDDARFVQPEGGARMDLTRHGSLRKVLKALLTAHADSRQAGTPRALSADDLLAAGWPDEKVRYDAGMLRVYTAVRRLRKLGLSDVLIRRDDGYLLSPDAQFVEDRHSSQ